MKILRFFVIIFSIWYLPGFLFEIYGSTLGSYSSYLMFLLILGYFFLAPKVKPNFAILLLGITYFLISGLNYIGEFDFYIYKFLKFIVFIIGISELITRSNTNYLFFFLMVGALSIVANAIIFPHNYGRYSGFYLNPNLAALLALIGFCFCFKVSNKILRMIGFIVFLFAGFLTFSRYFILMWLFLSLISVLINRKNAVILGIGVGSGALILVVASLLQLNVERLNALENILGNQFQQGTAVLSQDSRFQTWSYFFEDILNNAITGKGFTTMSGGIGSSVGVHNSILLTIGEAGIIPFLIMLVIFSRLLFLGLINIKTDLFAALLTLVICSYIFVSHNFYDNYLLLFFLVWLSRYLIRLTNEAKTNLKTL